MLLPSVWICIGQRTRVVLAPFVFSPFRIMADSKETTTKPVETFRKRGVSVSVFANEVKDKSRPMYKVALQRTYKKDGDFKTTGSLSRDDIPVARLLLDKAWQFIMKREEDDWKESDEE